jgi:hypothetical protein
MQAYALPTLLYGVESCTFSEQNTDKIQPADVNF